MQQLYSELQKKEPWELFLVLIGSDGDLRTTSAHLNRRQCLVSTFSSYCLVIELTDDFTIMSKYTLNI